MDSGQMNNESSLETQETLFFSKSLRTLGDARLQILDLFVVRDRVATQLVERANALFDGGEFVHPFVEEREHLPAETLLIHLRDARVDLSVGV
jgi:hypothetical protein